MQPLTVGFCRLSSKCRMYRLLSMLCRFTPMFSQQSGMAILVSWAFFSRHMNFSFCLLLLIIEGKPRFPFFYNDTDLFLSVISSLKCYVFFNLGVGMYMSNFHPIKNWLLWIRTLRVEEMRSAAFCFFSFWSLVCTLFINWFELASFLATSFLWAWSCYWNHNGKHQYSCTWETSAFYLLRSF